jgi:hypothetical protein
MNLARAPGHWLMLGAVLALAACADSGINSAVQSANQKMELNGSPFRYVARDSESMTLTLMPLPAGPTKAVPDLAKQALESIAVEEGRKGRSTASLERVHHLQDGREVWVLHTLGEGIAYIVAFENAANPKSNIRITGPTTFTR